MKTLRIYINDNQREVAAPSTLQQALAGWPVPEQPYAVAVNHCFVPRGNYAATPLCDGDRIDLVVAVQGG